MLVMVQGKRPGLRALKEVSGIEAKKQVGANAIGFALAPRINAAGRIGDPDLAVRLLLEKTPAGLKMPAEVRCLQTEILPCQEEQLPATQQPTKAAAYI